MASAFRSVLSVIVGFVTASVVMMGFEWTNGHYLYPALGKSAEGVTDPEVLRQLIAGAPAGALLVVIAGWLAGSVAGGFVSARLAPKAPSRHALVLGVLLTLAGVANNLMIPPPLWFWIAGLVVFVPATLAGCKISGKA